MPISAATDQPFRNVTPGGGKYDPKAKGYFNYAPSESWRPNVNLYENDTAYLVCVDLAGVDKAKIDVVLEGQHLHIRGSRPVPTPADLPERTRVRVHLMEIDHGAFAREVEMPADVERDNIEATHRNGMLWIELPKKR